MSYSEMKEQICTNVKKINEIIDDVNLSDKEQNKLKNAFTRHINSDHNGMITDKQVAVINSIPGFKEEVNASFETNMKHCNVLSKDDGIKTDTQIFKEIIKEAYDKTITHTGWRSPLVIKIPSGIYDIDDTIINNLMGLDAGRFVFEGSGWQNTIINFKPTTSKFLFDNYRLFGFTVFRGITFSGNINSKFMNGVGGGGGNAQNFSFFDCKFENFEQIINVTGDTMMSEVSFYNCKINGGSVNSILFNLANPQAVNWRFYSTDVESFSGILFNYLAGCTINFYQGSIIPVGNGVIAYVPANANYNLFGDGNAPLLNCNGTRFEFRDNSKLYLVNNSEVFVTGHFTACGMGGQNIDNDRYLCDFTKKGIIVFDNCYNLENIKFNHVIDENTWVNPMIIEFRSNASKSILNSNVNTVSNIGGYPTYSFVNCLNNSMIKLKSPSHINTIPMSVSKKCIEFGANKVVTLPIVEGGKASFEYAIDNIYLKSIGLYIEPAWSGGYGGMTFDVTISNYDGSLIYATGELNSSNGVYLEKDNLFTLVKNDKIKISLTSKSIWGNTFGLIPHLILEY